MDETQVYESTSSVLVHAAKDKACSAYRCVCVEGSVYLHVCKGAEASPGSLAWGAVFWGGGSCSPQSGGNNLLTRTTSTSLSLKVNQLRRIRARG